MPTENDEIKPMSSEQFLDDRVSGNAGGQCAALRRFRLRGLRFGSVSIVTTNAANMATMKMPTNQKRLR